MAQHIPKMAPTWPKMAAKVQGWPQTGPGMAQHCPNMAQNVFKMVLRWHLGLHTSKMASKTDEDTAIFEGAAVIAAGLLNILRHIDIHIDI